MDIVGRVSARGVRHGRYSITTGLSKRRRDEEESNVDALLAHGERTGAFDDGTLHVLDGQLAARRSAYTGLVEVQAAQLGRRVAARVAKATSRAEAAQARVLQLEAALRRVEVALTPVDAALQGGEPLPSVTAAFGPLTSPSQLDRHSLRSMSGAGDPDAPSAQITPIRSPPENHR